MSGEMSGIIHFCEFDWFEWVMFPDEKQQFTTMITLDLVDTSAWSIDIGPALVAKIIKENSQVFYKSPYKALTQEEWEQGECKNECSLFMESLHQMMGPNTKLRDLVHLGVEETLQIDPYENKSQNAETFPMLDEEPEVNPEWGNQYVNTDIFLPREDKMARVQVVGQKEDANGNIIGRSNQYPIILETSHYEVEFSGKEMTELAANIIA